MRVTYKHFESVSRSWDAMFTEAAAFATEVGPDRLIGVSHSHSHGGASDFMGGGGVSVITVWYWDDGGRKPDGA